VKQGVEQAKRDNVWVYVQVVLGTAATGGLVTGGFAYYRAAGAVATAGVGGGAGVATSATPAFVAAASAGAGAGIAGLLAAALWYIPYKRRQNRIESEAKMRFYQLKIEISGTKSVARQLLLASTQQQQLDIQQFIDELNELERDSSLLQSRNNYSQ